MYTGLRLEDLKDTNPHGRPRHRQDGNTEMDPKEIGRQFVD
jgi:hypothetical protein